MFKRFAAAALLSVCLLCPCLLYLDLFEPVMLDNEIDLLLALLIAVFSFWITGRWKIS